MSPPLRFAVLALLAAVAAGCPAGEPPGPPDGGGTTELRIEWAGRPATLPAAVASTATLDRAVFRLDDLRVVGDAGPIELDHETLAWSSGIVPTPDVPAGAPPGLYSRLLFELEGEDEGGSDEYAYELVGTARVGSTTRPFTIRDRGELSLSLEFSIMLPAGTTARIPVLVELDKLVEAVDFAQVPVDDGQFLVEGGSQLDAVRAKLREAFAIRGEP